MKDRKFPHEIVYYRIDHKERVSTHKEEFLPFEEFDSLDSARRKVESMVTHKVRGDKRIVKVTKREDLVDDYKDSWVNAV